MPIDPQSPIMADSQGFFAGLQCLGTGGADHMIVVVSLGQSSSDVRCLVSMVAAA